MTHSKNDNSALALGAELQFEHSGVLDGESRPVPDDGSRMNPPTAIYREILKISGKEICPLISKLPPYILDGGGYAT